MHVCGCARRHRSGDLAAQLLGTYQESVRGMRTKMRMFFTSVIFGAIATTGVACKDKSEEAAKARETANRKVTEAEEAVHEATAKAAAAAREADDRIAQERADLRVKFQKELDGADRKVGYLREKMANAKGAMRANADAA